MRVRIAWPSDVEKIRQIHKRAGYRFELPDPSQLRGLHVVEEDGEILGAAGYEQTAQIFAVLDSELKEPFRRLHALGVLHPPVARAVLKGTVHEVYAFTDPEMRGFGRRMDRFGWNRKLWDCWFMTRAEIAAKFGTSHEN